MRLDDDGVLRGATQIPSANCDERPDGASISLIVIHGISLPPGQFGGNAIERLFTNRLDFGQHPYFEVLRELRVSAHFLVRRGGQIVQFVPCGKRAWHAGVSSYCGRERCNDFSIGIELEGSDHVAYAARQYESLATLADLLRERYPIESIVGHSDISPGRKTDPGPGFDWQRFRSLLVPR